MIESKVTIDVYVRSRAKLTSDQVVAALRKLLDGAELGTADDGAGSDYFTVQQTHQANDPSPNLHSPGLLPGWAGG